MHDAYERAHFRFTESNRAMAHDTLNLFLSWYPKPLGRFIRPAILAVLDDPLLDAFGYEHSPGWVRSLVDSHCDCTTA